MADGAVEQGLGANAQPSRSGELWGERADVCMHLSNTLFAAAAVAGAQVAESLPESILRKLFAVLLIFTAGQIAWRAWRATEK